MKPRLSAKGLWSIVLMCAVGAFAASGCVDDGGVEGTEAHVPVSSVLSGLVVESDGTPVEGAAVDLVGTPSETAFTDVDGRFEVDVPLGTQRVVVSHGLHLSHHRQVDLGEGGASLEVLMLPVERAGFFEPGQGGSLRHDGASLSVPEGAFVFEDDGGAVTETVYWRLTHIEANADAPMSAIPALGSVRAQSILNASFFSEGRSVNLAPGVRAEIQLPLSEDFDPAVEGPLSAFYFDDDRFEWTQGAIGEIDQTASGLVWRTKVNRFAWWACASR